MRRLWICGAWRVALVAAYLAVSAVDDSLAAAPVLYPVVIVLGLCVVIYDVIERHGRA